MKYARIVEGVAVDVVGGDPSDYFHPSIAVEFELVPDDVECNWRLVDAAWTAPVYEESAPAIEYLKIGAIAFQLLFTPYERIKANELKATDPMIADIWKLLDDPRTDFVDMSLLSVQQGILYTLTAVKNAGVDIDVDSRYNQIMTGVQV